ncbi:DNA repair protein RadC [Caulobacter hibisci]|uniref:DNA repair protein RadC n=2 Tax=Caulobacter hibisci TaxID=2035993 RepID=A0ABS0SX61_9CAUL|nr:DNA repair protein RadC [Caulobacter hibisci]
MRFDVVDPDPTARARALAQRHGTGVLHDVELLQLHLARSGQVDGVGRARALIDRFGGLAGVLAADPAELARHLALDTILDLKLARETAVRLAAAKLIDRQLLTSFWQVAEYLKTLMVGLPREEFWVLFLDRKNQLLASERLGVGTIDHAPVYPREVMRRALELNASALILAHNHPSGDPQPSRPDIEMTKALIDAGKALNLTIHDHMIVGAGEVKSLRAVGLI